MNKDEAREILKSRKPTAAGADVRPLSPNEARDPSKNTPPEFFRAMLSAPDLRAMEIKQRPKLLGEWMREGDLGYLFAPRGAGKSWMAMLIANAVANRLPLGRWDAGDALRDIYYLDAEMNVPDLKERLHKLGITSSRFHVLSNELGFHEGLPSFNIAIPHHQDALSALLPDGSLFIIDNLSTSQTGMDENGNNDFDALRDWLMGLRHRHVTTLIVHHAGRNGAMRGASRREDMAHWIISLADVTKEDSNVKSFATQFTKCRNCRPGEAPPLEWGMADEGSAMVISCKPRSGPDVLLGHIQDGVESATELAELLGVATSTVSKWAKKLIAAKQIKKHGRCYVVIDQT